MVSEIRNAFNAYSYQNFVRFTSFFFSLEKIERNYGVKMRCNCFIGAQPIIDYQSFSMTTPDLLEAIEMKWCIRVMGKHWFCNEMPTICLSMLNVRTNVCC